MKLLDRLFKKSERRDTLASPSAWLKEALMGPMSQSGVYVSEMSALGHPAVWACVRLISETCATVPYKVFEDIGAGKVVARKHPYYQLLHDAPNSEMDSVVWRELMLANLLLRGNHFSQIVRSGSGRVLELWPLLPECMTVARSKSDGRLLYRYRADGEEQILEANEVLHIRAMALDGVLGLSPITVERDAIGSALAINEFGSRFFSNGAALKGVLSHPEPLDDDTVVETRRRWEAAYSGLTNAHKVAILDRGVEYKTISVPPEEAQWIESKNFSVRDIARIFRVPPHKIADSEAVSYASIEQENLAFVVDTIRPWVVRIESEVNRQLFADDNRYFSEFELDGLYRADIQTRHAAYATAIQNSWLSPNEVRALENLPPMEGGDTLLAPMNFVALANFEEYSQKMVDRVTNEEPGGQPDTARSLPVLMARNGRQHEHFPALPPGEETRDQELTEVQLRSLKQKEKLSRTFNKLLMDAAQRITKREAQDVQASAKKLLQRSSDLFKDWLDNYYRDKVPDAIRQIMYPVLATYIEQVAGVAADEVNFDSIDQEKLDAFVNSYVDAYSTRHVNRSLGELKGVLNEEDPYTAIQNKTNGWLESRHTSIASEETTRVGGAASVFAWTLAGVVAMKWVARGSDTCPYCQSLDGKTVDITKHFVSAGESIDGGEGGEKMTVSSSKQHPPLHKGCSCGLVAVTSWS